MEFLSGFCELATSFVDKQVATRSKGHYVPSSVAHPTRLEHLYGCSNCNYSEAGCRGCWDTPFATRPASRAKPHKGHYQNVPDAPTFRPTAEQFKDPFAYLAHIAPEAQKAGIALIIPPEGWSPPIQMLDQETGMLRKDFKVPTRIQPTHLICKRYPTPSGAPPSGSSSSSVPTTPKGSSGSGDGKEKKSTAVAGRCSKASMDVQKAALAAAAAAAQAAEEGKDVILNPAHWDAIATAAEATGGQFGYEHLEDPLTLHDFYRYADWAKRRHFNGPLLAGVKRQPEPPSSSSSAASTRPAVATASDAWRLYPCTDAARAARGATGKFVPGTCTPVPGQDVGDGSEWQEPSIDEVEAEFWRIVEAADEQVEALYGQDIDTATYSSAFPTIKELAQAEAKNLVKPPRSRGSTQQHNNDAPSISSRTAAGYDSDDETASDPANCCASCRCGRCQLCVLRHYTSHPWNINNLPQAKGSVLRFVREDVGGKPITGLMVPWVYVGSCFSAFCWHIEDHGLYSINYCHMGSPKLWYGVPATAAAALDASMRDALPHLFDKDHLLLHKLITMLSPSQLMARGVPVCRAVQVPGSFIVTFPDAYHAGFNSGFNIAEAVNFAAPNWLPFGSSSVVRYRCESRYMTFSHDAMLINVVREAAAAAASGSSSSKQLALPAPSSSGKPGEGQEEQQQAEAAAAASSSSLLSDVLQPAAARGLKEQFAAHLEQSAGLLAEAEAAAAMEHWQRQQRADQLPAAASFRRLVGPPGVAAEQQQPAVAFSSSVLESNFWWEAYPDASWAEAAQVVDEVEARKAALVRQRQLAKQLLAGAAGIKQLPGQLQQHHHHHHDMLHLRPEQHGIEHHLAPASQQHHSQGQRERVFTMRSAIAATLEPSAQPDEDDEEYLGPAAGAAAAAAAAGPSTVLVGRAARGLVTAAFARKMLKGSAAAAAVAAAVTAAAGGSSAAAAAADPKGDVAVAAIMRYILSLAEARRQKMLLKPPSPGLARLAVGELALRLELEGQRQQALLLQAGISRTAIMQGGSAAHDPATGVHVNTQGVECATCGCDLSLAAVVSEQDPGRAVCPEHIADLDGTRSECCLLLRYAPGQLERLLSAAMKLIPGADEAVKAARERQGWVAAGRFIGGAVLQKPGAVGTAAVEQEAAAAGAAAVVVKQEQAAQEQQQQQELPALVKQEQQPQQQRQRPQQPVVEVKLLGRLYDPSELNSKLFIDLEEPGLLDWEEEEEEDDVFDQQQLLLQRQCGAGEADAMEAEDDGAGTSGELAADVLGAVKQEGQPQEAAAAAVDEDANDASGGDQSSGSWWQDELDGQEDAFGFYTFAADAASSGDEAAAAADSDDDFRPTRGRGSSRKRRRAATGGARKRVAVAGPVAAAAPAAAVAVDAAV